MASRRDKVGQSEVHVQDTDIFIVIEGRATLYSSTEFKKVRLQYFTDEFKNWEREHGGA